MNVPSGPFWDVKVTRVASPLTEEALLGAVKQVMSGGVPDPNWARIRRIWADLALADTGFPVALSDTEGGWHEVD